MEKFDVNFIDERGKERSKTVKNSLVPISKFLESLPCDCLLVAENTGVYGDLLLYLCNQVGVSISFMSGYTIKHSLGLIKGKSDPVDARRIREYGERFSDKLAYTVYEGETMKELRELYVLREQLVKSRKALTTSETGRKRQPVQSVSVHKHIESVLKTLDAQIAGIEKEMIADADLKQNYELVTSIKGIGQVIATDLLIKTGNFQVIDTARKAASYAGVCPFPNASGTMVGKSKTSPFADKKLKSLLFMGARTAVKHNKEYNLYYRKKQLEGKPHFLIMNNVSNKLLRTVYSIVRSQTPWSETHICLDPRESKQSIKITSSEKKVA
ncbi:MAG: Transposase IS116/IS110/IS902 family protein [Bacteroidetes bacterium ADurb.Bin416]|nr:MAG: Transposase IS116/IS110/IS902 family protein [Bacteroidetes bacterium ADurb.Bin416]